MNTSKNWIFRLKEWAKTLKLNLIALYLVYRDKSLSWGVRVFTICVVAYAFSPIDLIPDFIPILGYLDDLILVPLGIYFAIKMIPQDLFMECLEKAKKIESEEIARNWIAGLFVVVVWVFVLLEVFEIFLH